jgi:hypothetical protein
LERMWRTAVKMIDRTVPSIDDNSWSLILLEGTCMTGADWFLIALSSPKWSLTLSRPLSAKQSA